MQELREHGWTLAQMPCPELTFTGMNRFWAVRKQLETAAYRGLCSDDGRPGDPDRGAPGRTRRPPVNGGSTPDVIGVLERCGWGAILLPPDWYGDSVATPLLTQIAEQVSEFISHGYDVVLIGERTGLAKALNAAGVSPRDAMSPGDDPGLERFLIARPAPPASPEPPSTTHSGSKDEPVRAYLQVRHGQ